MKRFFSTLLLFFTLSVAVNAQVSKVDSLTRIIKKAADDTAKVTMLLELAEAQAESDEIKAAGTAIVAQALAKTLNYPIGEARSSLTLAIILFEQREINESLKAFDLAIGQFEAAGAMADKMAAIEEKIQVLYNASRYKETIEAVDILYDYWASQADTSQMVTNLNRLAICYEEMGEYQQSIDKARLGYDLSLLSNDLEGAALNVNNIAFVYRAWGNGAKALEHFEMGLELAQKMDNKRLEGVFYQNIGIVHSRASRSVKALEAYFISLDIFESIDNEDRSSDILHNIGLVYKKHGELEKAIDYYNRSLKTDLKRADSLDIADSHHNLGNAYMDLEETEKALYHFRQSYLIASRMKRRCFNGEAMALGSFHYKLGNKDSAQFYLEQELNSIKDCENKGPLASTTYYLGLLATDLNQRNTARNYFEESLQSASESGYQEEIKDAALALYKWHKAAGNVTQALKYHELFQVTNDTLFNQENTRKLAWMEANYQLENVTDSLNRQQEEEALLFDQQIKAQRAQQKLILIISIGLIFCLILYYLYVRKQRQLKHEQALADEKSRGFNAVLSATEEERKRIAKDLHDGVVQQMGAVQLALAQIIPRLSAAEALEAEQIKKMTAAAASETRELSHQMMPKVLIEMGLLPAMQEVIDRSLIIEKTKVSFENFGLQDRYEDKIEIAIYRIFQELINNIIKHAAASEVSIQLFQNGQKLILIVEDNGQGIGQKSKDGIGLQNIKSRLSTIDGKVDYTSDQASGTVATVVIPL